MERLSRCIMSFLLPAEREIQHWLIGHVHCHSTGVQEGKPPQNNKQTKTTKQFFQFTFGEFEAEVSQGSGGGIPYLPCLPSSPLGRTTGNICSGHRVVLPKKKSSSQGGGVHAAPGNCLKPSWLMQRYSTSFNEDRPRVQD